MSLNENICIPYLDLIIHQKNCLLYPDNIFTESEHGKTNQSQPSFETKSSVRLHNGDFTHAMPLC